MPGLGVAVLKGLIGLLVIGSLSMVAIGGSPTAFVGPIIQVFKIVALVIVVVAVAGSIVGLNR